MLEKACDCGVLSVPEGNSQQFSLYQTNVAESRTFAFLKTKKEAAGVSSGHDF